jgi:hypothetical protein
LEILPLNNKEREKFTDLILESHPSKSEIRALVRASRTNINVDNSHYNDDLEKT